MKNTINKTFILLTLFAFTFYSTNANYAFLDKVNVPSNFNWNHSNTRSIASLDDAEADTLIKRFSEVFNIISIQEHDEVYLKYLARNLQAFISNKHINERVISTKFGLDLLYKQYRLLSYIYNKEIISNAEKAILEKYKGKDDYIGIINNNNFHKRLIQSSIAVNVEIDKSKLIALSKFEDIEHASEKIINRREKDPNYQINLTQLENLILRAAEKNVVGNATEIVYKFSEETNISAADIVKVLCFDKGRDNYCNKTKEQRLILLANQRLKELEAEGIKRFSFTDSADYLNKSYEKLNSFIDKIDLNKAGFANSHLTYEDAFHIVANDQFGPGFLVMTDAIQKNAGEFRVLNNFTKLKNIFHTYKIPHHKKINEMDVMFAINEVKQSIFNYSQKLQAYEVNIVHDQFKNKKINTMSDAQFTNKRIDEIGELITFSIGAIAKVIVENPSLTSDINFVISKYNEFEINRAKVEKGIKWGSYVLGAVAIATGVGAVVFPSIKGAILAVAAVNSTIDGLPMTAIVLTNLTERTLSERLTMLEYRRSMFSGNIDGTYSKKLINSEISYTAKSIRLFLTLGFTAYGFSGMLRSPSELNGVEETLDQVSKSEKIIKLLFSSGVAMTQMQLKMFLYSLSLKRTEERLTIIQNLEEKGDLAFWFAYLVSGQHLSQLSAENNSK